MWHQVSNLEDQNFGESLLSVQDHWDFRTVPKDTKDEPEARE